MISLKKLTHKGKALFLAYDQGIEHGPTDFNDKKELRNFLKYKKFKQDMGKYLRP